MPGVLVICPICGPETVCWGGRVISRVCDSCKRRGLA